MKSLMLTGFAWLVMLSCLAQTKTAKTMETEAVLKKKIALACKLTGKDQIKRMNELHQTLFKKVSHAVEHPASYELVFEQSDNAIMATWPSLLNSSGFAAPGSSFT